jgi:hypothetical protein
MRRPAPGCSTAALRSTAGSCRRAPSSDGRAALAAAIEAFLADPRGLSARLMSAIDAQGPIFRFRSVVEDRDGRIVFDALDAGEVDVDGRITALLTFGGASPAPLP